MRVGIVSQYVVMAVDRGGILWNRGIICIQQAK